MTKRIRSKRKPYLKTGENLWGLSHFLWKNDKWKYHSGEHKKKHRATERLSNLSVEDSLKSLKDIGYQMPHLSSKMNISYYEPRFSTQLKEKQKLKLTYINTTEKQFRNIYEIAFKKKGKVSENLLKILERRLDIVLLRSYLSSSLFFSRQLISHGHVVVNNQKVFSTGYILNPGDHVLIRKNGSNAVENSFVWKRLDQCKDSFSNCPYIEVDYKSLSFVYLHTPTIGQIPYYVNYDVDQIIRYYS